MRKTLQFFAACPRGLEAIVIEEVQALGIGDAKVGRGGVSFQGSLEQAYRVVLWSRCASRVVVYLSRVRAADFEQLYQHAFEFPWEGHLGEDSTFAVRLVLGHRSPENTHFGALRVKDAIVDRARRRSGRRPSVDTESPDVRIDVYMERGSAWLGVELAGGMHRRGYRRPGAVAPLRENLAAGVLGLAGWPARTREGVTLVDPMCGSGTLLIEGAMMALDLAPGLSSMPSTLHGWRHHDGAAWSRVRSEARDRARAARNRRITVFGADVDPQAIALARAQAEAAGLRGRVELVCASIDEGAAWPDISEGFVVTNPPYGKRIGDALEARDLRMRLDAFLMRSCPGWQAAVLLTTEQAPLPSLQHVTSHALRNGKIECRLDVGTVAGEAAPRKQLPAEEAQAFENRIRKNLRRLRKWTVKHDVHCYRIYDADLPQFSLAIDRYEDWLHVQEYAPPNTVNPDLALVRLEHALAALPDIVGVAPEHVVCKHRRRQRGSAQYESLAASEEFLQVREGGLNLLVNLRDRLDTGLFLDHRSTRETIRELAPGRHVLNLFSYTGTATVYAAAAGALSTTSVDLSRRYLDWARRNMELNGFEGSHQFVQEDVLQWVHREAPEAHYGLIFLDPPTFSNSKRMSDTFDVQRDHGALVRSVARLLTSDGVLVFSTHRKGFVLDEEVVGGFDIQDISRSTTPFDFRLGPHDSPHRCWLLRKASKNALPSSADPT